MTYTEAVDGAGENAGSAVRVPRPTGACDLQTEHERFLTEKIVGGPVIVTDYPKEIKAFYMRLNDDGKTVARDGRPRARHRRDHRRLPSARSGSTSSSERIDELGLDKASLLVVPATCGVSARRPMRASASGFERLLLYVTGMANIRDVIPFPRAPRLADF